MGRRITETFSKVTPESAENGDFSETGFTDEEGVNMELDEYDKDDTNFDGSPVTSVSIAVRHLRNNGATNPSSGHFHIGIWYSTSGDEVVSYRTGETIERSFHLKGFTEAEEKEIFASITKN